MNNASDTLADLYVVRQLVLNRLAAGEQRVLMRHLDEVTAEIEKALLSSRPLTEFKVTRLKGAITDIARMVSLPTPDLSELAELEADFVVDSMAKVGVSAQLPPRALLEQVSTSALVQGVTMQDWFTRLEAGTRFEVSRAIKTGVSLGETNAQIAKRIVSLSDKGTEVLARTRREAMAITRTGVQTISNDIRQRTFQENEDIIKGIQWLSTLDGKTSDICIARSSLMWHLPDYLPMGHAIPWNGGPPAHWNCRSTTIPVLKDLEELGINGVDVPKAMRSSMDGQVAADLSFSDFLKGKPESFVDAMLGKGRAQLWREGRITLSQLLDQRGNPLTFRQLRELYGKPTVVKPLKAKPIPAPTPTPPPAPSPTQRFDLSKDSGVWHNAAFSAEGREEGWRVAASIQDIKVDTTGSGASASGDRLITMSARGGYTMDNARALDVWRHEFGHVFDARQGRVRGDINTIGKSRRLSTYRSDAPDYVAVREADAQLLFEATGRGRKSAAGQARQALLADTYEDRIKWAVAEGRTREDFAALAKEVGLDLDKLEPFLKRYSTIFENGGYAAESTAIRLAKGLEAWRLGDVETFINALGYLDNRPLREAVLKKGGMWGQISDTAGSITGNKVSGWHRSQYGHKDSYFTVHGKSVETYANLFAAFSHEDPFFWELMEHFFPNMTTLMKKDIEQWISKQNLS